MKTYNLPNNSMVAVHDIFDTLPEFMHRADCIFTDLPYNQAMLSNYSNRDGVALSTDNDVNFDNFLARFFACVLEIKPITLFVEIGAQHVGTVERFAEGNFKYCHTHNNYYLHSRKNKCYIVQASNRQLLDLGIDDIDEQKAIQLICTKQAYKCIGDLCMGKGLVGFYANKVGRQFVGTELNENRLAVLLHRIKTGSLK